MTVAIYATRRHDSRHRAVCRRHQRQRRHEHSAPHRVNATATHNDRTDTETLGKGAVSRPPDGLQHSLCHPLDVSADKGVTAACIATVKLHRHRLGTCRRDRLATETYRRRVHHHRADSLPCRPATGPGEPSDRDKSRSVRRRTQIAAHLDLALHAISSLKADCCVIHRHKTIKPIRLK